ncbi:hypothetical protein FIBSPDRAFT_927789 [Athelia psychrophila]|uniref:Uncharacterized protein n=1 Tax=Athelia psychrophila TaxID=1759441 RepID=A0A166RC48_9AGAM|nr:hypothetical protein FIBSPDRAFT_927789 [Fibularhizoctonia sp. CBS 109695]
MRKLLNFRRRAKTPSESLGDLKQSTNIPPAKPTWELAIKEWLEYSQTNTTKEEYQSINNFARLFRKWLRGNRGTIYLYKLWYTALYLTKNVEPEAIIPKIYEFSRAMDVGYPDQPIPRKIDQIGTNTSRFIDFLSKKGYLEGDIYELLRQCELMDDNLRRQRRVEWIMTQHDVFFKQPVGGKSRHTALEGDALKGTFRIADLGENFVLVQTYDNGELALSPTDPLKMQIPCPAIGMLQLGDTISCDICKATGADYWVPVSSARVDPTGLAVFGGPPTISEANESPAVQALDAEIDKFLSLSNVPAKPIKSKVKGKPPAATVPAATASSRPQASLASLSESKRELKIASILADDGYQRRRHALLQAGALPDLGFPDAMYTEEWFLGRENHWERTPDEGEEHEDEDDDEDGDDDDDDSGGEGGEGD